MKQSNGPILISGHSLRRFRERQSIASERPDHAVRAKMVGQIKRAEFYGTKPEELMPWLRQWKDEEKHRDGWVQFYFHRETRGVFVVKQARDDRSRRFVLTYFVANCHECKTWPCRCTASGVRFANHVRTKP